jgi:hypothetical protein
MSERDVKRLQVLAEVRAGKRTVVSAAAVLDLGVRQTFRLISRYEAGGAGELHVLVGAQAVVLRNSPLKKSRRFGRCSRQQICPSPRSRLGSALQDPPCTAACLAALPKLCDLRTGDPPAID